MNDQFVVTVTMKGDMGRLVQDAREENPTLTDTQAIAQYMETGLGALITDGVGVSTLSVVVQKA